MSLDKSGEGEEGKNCDYFDAFARLEMQELLLKDSVRMLAYRKAIWSNKKLFKDKIVMDVGCGTGILALFAAEAGASKVIAVECSGLAETAKEVVKANNKENIVMVVKGTIEEMELPKEIKQVDLIMAEWMGHGLYMESMFHSVLQARDKWLKPGGHILPNLAKLYVAGITDRHYATNLNFWNNVEGFDMTSIRRTVAHEAVVDCVTIQQLMTEECHVHTQDMNTAKNETLNFHSNLRLKVLKTGVIDAIVVYFDVSFLVSEMTESTAGFSTSPKAPWTHWEQTLLHLDKPLHVASQEIVTGVFGVVPSANEPHGQNFELAINFKGSLGTMESFKIFTNNQNPLP
ncbi:uncharacterized protein Dwil_GK22483 [Drosophila willistoni]|uniref:type I protein arginine methyltransferase n=1 Tax=Drosophila willistoni TaxID=7260 RepID=B4NFP9_DROWI|nr:protein arginine N-methyltransferase 1 [Drosophila willistoni]EDW83116.1 uncharacterized protein Dwil_GK22483 [Drosophila willistoni]